jgi:1-deoxy-D-xylulose-5-phosphate reductoisomerase
MKKRLIILGSTGSIGLSALDIFARQKDRIELYGISAHTNIDLLARQTDEFNPKFLTITDKESYQKFRLSYPSLASRLLDFEEGAENLSSMPEVDIVLNAIVGAAGLKASLATVKAGKRLALANKESMVIGGPLINELIAQTGAELIPVDSEHSAIWQALHCGKKNEVRKIILTGSGGPFRNLPKSEFINITKEQALNHPTWKMGAKITIDSATMMNKALEILEAVQLFGIPAEKIEVMIHPQSVIHSMVEFEDSSIIAQMSYPDMRLPIALALFYPERVESPNGRIDLVETGNLSFQKPDADKFPLLKAAYRVAESGGTAPAVFNAANEIVVNAFLKDIISFNKISDIIINTVDKHEAVLSPNFDQLVEADRWGREYALELIG